jgi:hypothetical protein
MSKGPWDEDLMWVPDLQDSELAHNEIERMGGADMDDVEVSMRLVQDSKGNIKWMQYHSISPWHGWWIDEPQQ